MLAPDVVVGGVYVATVSGKRVYVKVTGTYDYRRGNGYWRGWIATNLSTGREIRLKTAARLSTRIR